MAIGRIIKVHGKQCFLTRNLYRGSGMFAMCKGTIYLIYDNRGVIWMKVAVRRVPGHGTIVTDLASGYIVVSGIGAKTYRAAVRKVIKQYETINRVMALDNYKHDVELCQKQYTELREVGILK